MSEEFKPMQVEGATVYFIGRTGSRAQYRVYTVNFCNRQYNVVPGKGEVKRLDEVVQDGKIKRYSVDVSRLVGLKMLDLVDKYERALIAKYAPE